jgi:hypothetical protein
VVSWIRASFVIVLVLLTVLGHACEWPIGLATGHHGHEDAHESSEHHDDPAEVVCDAVLAVKAGTDVSSTGAAAAAHARPYPVLEKRVPRAVGILPPHPDARYRRPPLFLLHAAHLI